jgi:hypothetical protein
LFPGSIGLHSKLRNASRWCHFAARVPVALPGKNESAGCIGQKSPLALRLLKLAAI